MTFYRRWLTDTVAEIFTRYIHPYERVLVTTPPDKDREVDLSLAVESAAGLVRFLRLRTLIPSPGTTLSPGNSLPGAERVCGLPPAPDSQSESGPERFDMVIAYIPQGAVSWAETIEWHDFVAPAGRLAFLAHETEVRRELDTRTRLARVAQRGGLVPFDHIVWFEAPVDPAQSCVGRADLFLFCRPLPMPPDWAAT